MKTDNKSDNKSGSYSNNKSLIRSEIIKRIQLLSEEQKLMSSYLIQENLKKSLVGKSGVWVGFQSLPSEPNINWSEVSNSIEWAFPVIKDNKLEFKKNSQKFGLVQFGVYEPLDGENVDLPQIDGFIIPALGYDLNGCRLGRGKGYYDRTLNQYQKNKIGLCFDVAFYQELPQENHDLICNQIITEKQIYQVKNSKGEQKWN